MFARPRRSTNVSTQSVEVSVKNEDEPGEWMAQVEPGVQITFVSLPVGWNDLKRIRLSREACLNNGPTSKFLPLGTPPRSEDVFRQSRKKKPRWIYRC
ncbi:protein Brevis radix-like 1 isoform X2 [Apium graveolens]|uniref:protein Brevis radix-like 1 isoform X2 n=1 Tax=Apium graveolens TaxID=4045 RepID=UPI003D795B6D